MTSTQQTAIDNKAFFRSIDMLRRQCHEMTSADKHAQVLAWIKNIPERFPQEDGADPLATVTLWLENQFVEEKTSAISFWSNDGLSVLLLDQLRSTLIQREFAPLYGAITYDPNCLSVNPRPALDYAISAMKAFLSTHELSSNCTRIEDVDTLLCQSPNQNYYCTTNTTPSYDCPCGKELLQILDNLHALTGAVKLFEELPAIDFTRLEKWKATYGAKGGTLKYLKSILRALQDFDVSFSSLDIPEFKLAPTSLYKKWAGGQDITETLEKLYQWSKGRAIIVRSSARFSEDTEQATGAGVYDSIKVREGASFEEFQDAVTQVFKSTNSESAIAYRQENNITAPEEMGLIIHLDKNACDEDSTLRKRLGAGLFYVNSCLKGIPNCIEVRDEKNHRAILNTKSVLQLFSGEVPSDRMFAIPVDSFEVDTSSVKKAAKLAMVLEFLFKKKQQVELYFHNQLLQSRPLPSDWSVPAVVPTPRVDPPLLEIPCVGFIDTTLSLLEPTHTNATKAGVLIVNSSFCMGATDIDSILPNSGVVIVASEFGNGHFETRAVSKDLVVATHPIQNIRFTDAKNIVGHAGQILQYATKICGYNRVRVVADGLTLRIYPPEDE